MAMAYDSYNQIAPTRYKEGEGADAFQEWERQQRELEEQQKGYGTTTSPYASPQSPTTTTPTNTSGGSPSPTHQEQGPVFSPGAASTPSTPSPAAAPPYNPNAPSFDGKSWTGYTAPSGQGNSDYFTGFNTDKIANPGAHTDAQTSKYAFARYAQSYDPRDPASLGKIVEAMKRDGFPVNFDGRDKVDFGDGYGGIDVLRNWVDGKGGDAWAWQPGGGGASSTPYNSGGSGTTTSATPDSSLTPVTSLDGGGGGGDVDPFASIGGGVKINGGWVPKDHPLANRGGKTTTTTEHKVATKNGSEVGYGGLYAPPTAGAYTAPDLGTPSISATPATYQAGDLTDFSSITDGFGDVNAAQKQAVMDALFNPSMSATNVAQLKEREKEQALAMQEQLLSQAMQRGASRGTVGGGYTAGLERRIGSDTLNSVIGSNREVDLAKMTQDRKDLLDGIGVAETYQKGTFDRGIAEADQRLKTEMSQEDLYRIAADQGLDAAGLNFDKDKFAWQSKLDQEGLRQAQADDAYRLWEGDTNRLQTSEELRRLQEALQLQGELGRGGLANESRRISEGGRQFDTSADLEERKFAEAMRQFNQRLGLDYGDLLLRGQLGNTNALVGSL